MKRLPLALVGATLVAAGLSIPAEAADKSLGVDPAAIDSNVNTVPDHTVGFTPATVTDELLFGGEPGLNFDPKDTSGKRSYADWPVSSRQNIGVLFRSEDGGLSYQKRYADPADVVGTGGPACLGRQTPYCFSGGGGDTDVNINPSNGVIYYGSQEALANQAVGTSFDKGDTFPSDHVFAGTATTVGVDRQWIGSLRGTKTEYLSYHVPAIGEFVHVSTDEGKIGSWSLEPLPSIQGVTQSGSMVVDNSTGIHHGTVYIGYLGFPLLNQAGTGFNVGVSTDGAQTFVSHPVPHSDNARNFTVVNVDSKGNLYATWVDSGTQKTYLSTAKADAGKNKTAPGSQWSDPVIVSNGLHVTIFSNLAAGDPGRIAIGYYGTTAKAATPDDVAKGKGGWSPYVALSTNALCQWDAHPCTKGPRFHQTPISHHINQDDNICTSGTACAATGGNRNLLDYFDLNIDPQGHLGVVWTDTTNATGMGFVKVARQATGPSLFAKFGGAAQSMRYNGYADPSGDARYPFYGAKARTSPSNPVLDLRGTTIRMKDANTIEVTMKLTSSSSIGSRIPQAGSTDGLTPIQQAKYLTRWDYAGHVYYAGANVAQGETAPAYFSGEVNTDSGVLAAGGGTTYYGTKYNPQHTANGRISGNSVIIDVPTSTLGNPAKGASLYSVGSYAILGPNDQAVVLNTIPVTVDSTPTFDTVLGSKVTSAQPPVQAGSGSGTPRSGSGGSGSGGGLATTGLSTTVTLLGFGLIVLALAVGRRRRTRPLL
ncbi:MAG: hypothetical protein QOK42_1093 [Frankiaceae bacterium]|nr:hypothetical protein [Frankiaceae bacterium]